MLQPLIEPYNQWPSSSDRTVSASAPLPTNFNSPSSSWSTEDDEFLLKTSSLSLTWNHIQRGHFPSKTPNACRKRYERLMEKSPNSKWDGQRADRVVSHCIQRGQTPQRPSRRSAPYPSPVTGPEISRVALSPARATDPTTRHPPPWAPISSTSSLPLPAIEQYNRCPSSADRIQPVSPPLPANPSHPSSPWSTEDDEVLLGARSRALGWNQIQRDHFPSKTPNACRKRYERLAAKRRNSEWDDQRADRFLAQYMELREQIWRPLAQAPDMVSMSTGSGWRPPGSGNVRKFSPLVLIFPGPAILACLCCFRALRSEYSLPAS
jgi:Myb-like DNA-binding domain